VGFLQDYQEEYERLGNRVHGWTPKTGRNIYGRSQAHYSRGHQNVKCEKVIDELFEENVPKLQHEPEIFLHALTGWSTPKTMIVTSKVGQHEFVVLIDNESTNDFIGDKMANSLHLHVVSTKPFTVRVTNWNKLHCQERFEHVHIMLQGIYFSFTLYLSYLTKLDLVFGV
jgi:hypothetical protein